MRRDDWLDLAFIFFFGLLLIGMGLTLFLPRAHAGEVGKCWPFEDALKVVVERAQTSHSELRVVPGLMMPSFIMSLGDKGKGIVGDAAFILATRLNQRVLFVKRGPALCLAIYDNGHEPADVDI